MVRLAVASDSHGSEFWLGRFLERCRREKYDARWLEKRLDAPVIAVAGNCDSFSSRPRLAKAAYEGHALIAVHGHLQEVKYGYDRLPYFAEEQGAGIALFGHTHRQFAGYAGPVLLLNPGALQRGEFAELMLDGDRVVPRELSLAAP